MSEEYDERIHLWRQRWKEHPQWVDDVIASLRRTAPDRTADEIALFPWYTPENGFHPLRFSPQSTSLILDLRGVPLRSLDLSGLQLPFALLEGADFFRTNLKGADLSYCRAIGAVFHQAVLSGARFIAADLKFADLSMADLTDADLTRARLDGADLGWAHLQEAALRDAVLTNARMERIKAEETDFTAADLSGADLSVAICTRAGFENAHLEKAKFVAAHLEEANLIGADLREADLSLAYLNGAYLRNANLRRADLTRVYLDFADLENADLSGAILFASRMIETGLRNANLSAALLKEVDACRADFRGADLKGADLSGAELSGARLEGADLREAILTDCRLRLPGEAATVDENTLFGWIAEDKTGIWGRKSRSSWLVPPPGSLSPEEKEQLDFDQVKTLYNQVRMLFRDNGLYHRAALYFSQDNYWRTRSDLWEGRWGRFLIRWLLFEKFTGYGEKPLRIFFNGMFIIIIFAVLYLFNGFRVGDYLINYNLDSIFTSPGTLFVDFWRSLLFSILSFVTISSESLRPTGGISQALSSLEGFFGLFIIVLGGIVFLRKAVRK